MDREKLKKSVRSFFSGEKKVRLIVLLGLCGIALISLSGLGSREKETKVTAQQTEPDVEAYRRELEKEIGRVVSAITGEASPTVLITLKTGSRYQYARNEKSSSREHDGESSRTEEVSHVILKDGSGAQYALTVAEIGPEIKGVVIVSERGGDPVIREKLVGAVKTALGLLSSRVCVTDTG